MGFSPETDQDGNRYNPSTNQELAPKIDPNAFLPSVPIGTLLGAMDSNGVISSAFFVGSSDSFTSPVNGILLLAYNDLPGEYGNNSGSYSVTVTVSGATNPNQQYLNLSFGNSPYQVFGNEPVNLSTGNFINKATDLNIPTRGLPLEFTRFYNSTDAYTGPMGRGWTDSYNSFLTINGGGSISVKYGDGHVATFTPNGSGFSSQPGSFESLSTGPDNTYILTFKDQTRYTYNSAGQLIATQSDRNGNTDTLGYENGLLSSVTGPAGRSLNFGYDSQNQLTSVTDSVDRAVYFTHDSGGNLATVRDVRGGITKGCGSF